MVELKRTIRFCLTAEGGLRSEAGCENSYAGWPAMRGLGRYYELNVSCRGEPEPRTGYFVNITHIDAEARRHALPVIADYARLADPPMGRLLHRLLDVLQAVLDGSVVRVGLAVTPTFELAMESRSMDTVLLSQEFSFSAAHRLHVETLSEQENRRIFGKCNNPAGHGHNYRLQVTVAAPVDEAGRVMDVEDFEQIVRETVIERFDHKHLNLDTEEFARLNPSVEHIAMVIYQLLEPAFEQAGVHLDQVTVWETEKTACTYRGR